MRLSDAILLGDSLRIRDCHTWIERDSSCGCALGGALLAANIADAFINSPEVRPTDLAEFRKLWPWFTGVHEAKVSGMFHVLCDEGRGSIEEIADYVRSIEPAEEAEKPDFIDPRDEAPWSDTQTEIERQNSIKGR